MDLNFLLNRAIKFHLQGKFEKAELDYTKIIKAQPQNMIANNNLASLKNIKKDYKTSLNILEKVLKVNPIHVDALNNKGIALMGLKRFDEALNIFKTILKIKPNFLNAINNIANCYKLIGNYEDAIEYYQRAINIKPNYIESIFNIGICFYELNKFDDAEKKYIEAIKINPSFIEANFALSIIKLLKGNYKEGLPLYEWRKKRSSFKKYDFYGSKNEWLGNEDINNKIIYITKEQALGDYIQFSRYFPLIEKMGAKMILDPPKPIRNLIDNMGINYTHADDLKKLSFDYYCPIASLPLAFNTTIETIPNQTPYFFTPAIIKKYWIDKLNSKKIKVGLKWSGNSKYVDDKNRSTSLAQFLPLFDLPYEFHSLHIEYTKNDEKLKNTISNLYCHKDEIIGLDNTAGLVNVMDLIISVDTGIVQLCGALGKKFWNLLPYTSDHRWLLDRNDSPWFPGAKLYRQSNIGDWDTVIKNVKKDLMNFKN